MRSSRCFIHASIVGPSTSASTGRASPASRHAAASPCSRCNSTLRSVSARVSICRRSGGILFNVVPARLKIYNHKRNLGLITTTLCLTTTASAAALEPWADDMLPVKDGLELWLDASRENTSRTAAPASGRGQELPRIPNGAPLDTWHDASGNKRDVRQLVPAARPHLVQSPQGTAVRFDGKDDFLLGSGPDKAPTNFTVFVQASARTNQGGMRAFLAASRYGRNDYSTGLNLH